MLSAIPAYPGVTVEGATAGTIPLEWTHVKGIEPNGTLLYLHGGGYFPGSIATHRRLTSEAGERPDRVIIAGDSAGGGFTFATLVAVRDAGDPLPDGGFGISPWTDLAGTASR